MRIIINPDQIRTVSEKIQRFASDLNTIQKQAQNAIENLSWEIHEKAEITDRINVARSKAPFLISQLEEMRAYLNQTAEKFETADNQDFNVLSDFPVAGGIPWWMNRSFSISNKLQLMSFFPQRLREIWATILSPVYPILPMMVGAVTNKTLIDRPSWVPESKQEIPPTAEHKTPASHHSSRTTFGDLLDEKEQTPRELPKGEEASEEVSTTSSSDSQRQKPARWWREVPFQSQKTLQYGDGPTAYGCVLASTHMILEYWHNEDPKNQTMSAQELVDINVVQGEYENKPMAPKNVFDELHELGYEPVPMLNSTKEDLKEQLKRGPVLAIVKVDMKPKGDPHAVVVTGLSPDGSTVKINDPLKTQGKEYTWNQFNNSWGSDFGPGKPSKNLLIIHPKKH